MADLVSLHEALEQTQEEVRARSKKYINPSLVSMMSLLDFDKPFVRAQGVSVWDNQGREYLDFLGGYGALNLGHNPPEVLQVIKEVAQRPNLLQVGLNPLAAAMAENLAILTPGDLGRTFFCNSGAEAVEGALKLAKAYSDKPVILYMDGSFHGKSLGALSVTGRTKYQKPFKPLVPGCEKVPFGDLTALRERMRQGDVAAVIMEPIQGEGGIQVPPDGFLSGARGLCSEFGALMIVDEIQTGYGRTGKLFACEHEGVVPDVLCLAKSLGGGVVPIGAVVARPAVWDKVYGGMERATLHTSTFGGNTLAMAVALSSVASIVDQNLAERSAKLGAYFMDKLQELAKKYPIIKEVRGRGLFIGLEFREQEGLANLLSAGKLNEVAREYMGAMVAGSLLNEEHIITAFTLNNPNVIRLEPPLIVTQEQIDRVLAALDATLQRTGSFWKASLSTAKTVVSGLFKKR